MAVQTAIAMRKAMRTIIFSLLCDTKEVGASRCFPSKKFFRVASSALYLIQADRRRRIAASAAEIREGFALHIRYEAAVGRAQTRNDREER